MDIYIFSHKNKIKHLLESYGNFELPNTGMVKLVGNSASVIYPYNTPPVFSKIYNLPPFLTVYLIRHAEGEHNIQSPFKRIYSWTSDPGLTSNGVRQTKKLARKIKQFYNPIRPSIFCASELHRAQETARLVMSDLVVNSKIKILPNIGEVIFKNEIMESFISPFVPENNSRRNNFEHLDWSFYKPKSKKNEDSPEHLLDFLQKNLMRLV